MAVAIEMNTIANPNARTSHNTIPAKGDLPEENTMTVGMP